MKTYRTHLLICGGTGCQASGSEAVKEALEKEIIKRGLDSEVRVIETGCNGFCAMGPVMVVQPEGIFYQKLQKEDVPELVEEHLLKGRPVKRLFYVEPASAETINKLEDIPFFSKQKLIVLKNKSLVDPEIIDEYISQDGYLGVAKALTEMTPEEIINEMKISGLRGRGGAGFPTGLKWEFGNKSPGDIKYVLCNADEGDPGAFMDRSVLEADPHAVLEGMIIGAKAIGAHQGYIYCRAEYPLAIRRLDIAISQAREYNLLGKDILGSGFDFDLEVYQGAGAFVCGEETALMHSIEGKRGMPRPRPPFPAQQGLWKKPSVLNNVETLANVAQIILKGGEWYAGIGTEGSKGTKVFALTGTVNNIGLVEVPMGTSLKSIIYEIGGGIPGNKKFKAVQLGGPSGGCVPGHLLDTLTDYEAIAKVGAIMGSGGMIVMDEDTCMVDMARFFIEFCKEESCGKCTPCREGTSRMLEILEKITQGKGEPRDLVDLRELSEFIKDTALCGLGQTAPNPVLSTLQYFLHEYEDHILEKKCEAGVCADLFKAKCVNACPIGQDVPGYLSLVGEGRYEEAFSLIYQTNPMPGICGRVCTHPCMDVCLRGQTDEALSIPKIKRFASDMAIKRGFTIHVDKAQPKNQKVAIVGGGPGGLAAAYHLALMGYEPTLFEELPELGGMLRYGIPSYRLPRDILDQEIEFILKVGVKTKTNCRVGHDVTLDDLQKDYDALFIAVGAHRNLSIGIPGEDLPNVIGGARFLRDMESGTAPKVGKRVAVIGGGNVAIDVARTCRRMGAAVTVLYRRERKDMPAYEEEIEDALVEGIDLKLLLAPKSICQANNRLLFELDECELKEFDRSGRRRPVPIEGRTVSEEYDTIFSAIGQAPELSFAPSLRIERGTISADRLSLATNLPGVFAGGDAVTGPARIVDALAHGKRTAKEIDKYLSDKRGEKAYEERLEKISITMKIPEETIKQPMAEMPKLSPEERIKNFMEVELGFDEETAKNECSRCLRCDVMEE
ncbi:MAG: NADH-quinone oxidoreductase subunit NuoF [Deltaproteobacteria bacterium]|nr:NADH-quinone oxidoreductase subunit NuoF [Deltaproteobacteria bacterium]